MIGITEYYDTGEGLLIKHSKGRNSIENLLMEYFFKGDIKKINSPRYVKCRGEIKGRMLVSRDNKQVSFYIYLKINDYDIRFQFPLELMKLFVDARQAMVYTKPLRDLMWNFNDSSLDLNKLYYTPKLEECLFGERKRLTENEKKLILLKHSKEILDLENQHERMIGSLIAKVEEEEREAKLREKENESPENPQEEDEFPFDIHDDEEFFGEELDFGLGENEDSKVTDNIEKKVIDKEQAIIAFLEEVEEKEKAL